jgi:hypothetical protein
MLWSVALYYEMTLRVMAGRCLDSGGKKDGHDEIGVITIIKELDGTQPRL